MAIKLIIVATILLISANNNADQSEHFSTNEDQLAYAPVEGQEVLGSVTAEFRPAGVYYITSNEKGDGYFRSKGPKAEDTLIPCGAIFAGKTWAGQVCYEQHSGQVVQANGGEPTDNSGEPSIDWAGIAQLVTQNSVPGSLSVRVQPIRGWVYTGVDTILYLEGSPTSSESTQVGGMPVTVKWSVSENRIDFNDPSGVDSTVAVADMGAPYPNETITWVYNTEGRATPSVTTVWDATVEVGGQSFTFPGVRQTTATAPTIEIRKPKISLVAPGQ